MATERNRIPDVLLDRFLADDLAPEARRQIEVALDTNPELRARLDQRSQEQQAFLATEPPADFARRVAGRLEIKDAAVAAAASRPRRLWAWVLGPSAAAATAAVLVTVFTVTRQSSDEPSAVLMAPEEAPATTAPPAVVADEPVAGEAAVEEPTAGGGGAMADRSTTRTGRRAKRAPRDDKGKAEHARQAAEGSTAPPKTQAAKPSPTPPPPKPEPDTRAFGIVPEGNDYAPEPEPAGEAEAAGPTDSVADAPTPAAPARRAARPKKKRSKVSHRQLLEVVRRNAKDLSECAESSNDVPSGKLELVLSWTVTPRGRVERARLDTPEELRDTRLSRCLEREMRTWRFAEAAQPTSARVPVTVIVK